MLAVLLASSIIYRHNQQQMNNPVVAMLDPGTCPQPCWYSIQPGKTRMTDAVRILLSHPDLDPDSLRPDCAGCIAFALDWKEPQRWVAPNPLDRLKFGVVVYPRADNEDIVGFIDIHAGISLAQLVIREGIPNRITVGRLSGGLYVAYWYTAKGMLYTAFTSCRAPGNMIGMVGTDLTLFTPSAIRSFPSTAIETNRWKNFSSEPLEMAIRLKQCTP